MVAKGTVRVIQGLLVVGVVVVGWLVIRVKSIEPKALGPGVGFKKSLETYQQRMRATERLFLYNRM